VFCTREYEITVLIFKACCKKQRITAQFPARGEEQVFNAGINFA